MLRQDGPAVKADRTASAPARMTVDGHENGSRATGPADYAAGPVVTAAFQLKLISASVAQPISCTQTFCTPGATGSRSDSDTIILAVKDSMIPSAWR